MPDYTNYGLPTPVGALTSFLASAAQSTSIPVGSASLGQSNISTSDIGSDPYLDVLPAFAYSMPVQLIVLASVVTLLALLSIHLLFTIRYHYPLSKFNYIAQSTAVLLSLVITLVYMGILSTSLIAKGQEWPYMFDYIEIPVPGATWSMANTAGWLLLQALVNLSLHVTHIQFLTLLFPSTLEVRLIMILLGPLAIASSALSFADLSSNPAVVDLGDAVRNVASSTLTLLYTSALLIWGLTLNRKRAWRTDGGTAAFGALAITMGMMGSAVNFVEIREQRMRWMGGVVNTILLWQSWLSFWWWVGSGMYAGEAHDIEKKNAKRQKRLESRRLKKFNSTQTATVGISSNVSVPKLTTLIRRFTNKSKPDSPPISIELLPLSNTPARSFINSFPPRSVHSINGGNADTLSTTSNASTPMPSFWFTKLIHPFVQVLSKAHDEEALERNKKNKALDNRRGGIKSLVTKAKKERGERRAAVGGNLDISEIRAGYEDDGIEPLADNEEGDAGWEDVPVPTKAAIAAERQNRIWKWRSWRQREVNQY